MLPERSLNIRPYDGLPSPSRSHGSADSTALEGHRTKKLPTRRRGSMLVETAIGVALAVVVMIAVAQLVAVVVKQRHGVAQTRLATEEVANVMERVMVLPWNDLTAEAVARFAVSPETTVGLAEPQLSVAVTNLDDPLPTKQIEITLSWQDLAHRRVEPVRLVAWKHQPQAAE
ncbi:MAG: hypothetical protein ABI614_03415 [Planctomycetota bacterium]